MKFEALGNGFFGHPEVKFIGLVTLLFAGTTSLNSFKYSIFIDTVKKLKQGSLSAGNSLIIKGGTSETLRNEIVFKTENIHCISLHNSRHLRH